MSGQRRRGRPRQEIRLIDDVEYKWCAHHKAWEPLEQFDRAVAGGAYYPICRVARIFERDSESGPGDKFIGTGTGIDPDLDAIAWKLVVQAADDVVKKVRYAGAKIDRQFVLAELNYMSLVAPVRAMIGPDGLCAWCGLPFTKKHRVSFDHVQPPRWDGGVDWERLHAQNLQVMHFGENGSKGMKPFEVALRDNMQRWMAERRWARHADEKGWPSLEAMRLPPPVDDESPAAIVPRPQMDIFDLLDEA